MPDLEISDAVHGPERPTVPLIHSVLSSEFLTSSYCEAVAAGTHLKLNAASTVRRHMSAYL
jgi:hypothetical protein